MYLVVVVVFVAVELIAHSEGLHITEDFILWQAWLNLKGLDRAVLSKLPAQNIKIARLVFEKAVAEWIANIPPPVCT
jgi:hypothetical protein